MSKTRITILVCALLALLTIGAFWRVLDCGFVSYDDDLYVTANRWVQAGPTVQSVEWAFTAFQASNWHPITWISHMLDWKIYGSNPLGHHLTNLILHMLSVILLFLLMRRMTGCVWRSAFVAALFAVHPLHVESVVWVAERKDVLSALLWMLTLHAYVSYVRHPARGRYLLTLMLFALGLMAKPMLVSLPLVLLLVDYWPLGRCAHVSLRRLVSEKIPFFVLAGASSVVTYIAQRGDSVVSLDKIAGGVRVANAMVSFVAYLVKTVWPSKLAVIYPHPLGSLPTWQVVGSVLLLAALSIFVLKAARTRPYLAVGWLWYVITLIPVIGLVQVGLQGMADRYTYVPLIGIFIALTWGIAEGVGEWESGRVGEKASPTHPLSHSPTRLIPLAAILVIAACTAGTWHQTGYWKDSITLFQRAVDVTQRNGLAESNLAAAYIEDGDYKRGMAHALASIRIEPGPRAYNNIGVIMARTGRLDQAVPYYEKALGLDRNYAESHHNLGYVLLTKRRYAEAAEQFRKAISRKPDNADSHYFLACALAGLGEPDEAIRHYREALLIKPQYHLAHFNLGVILMGRSDFEGAVAEFEAAIRAKPDYAQAHHNLGQALDSLQRFDEAMSAYREAIRLRPSLAEAHNNLAIDLYDAGRYKEAWEEVRLARKYGREPHPQFLKALAAKSK